MRFIGYDHGNKNRIRRTVEKLLLKFYSYNKKCQNRLGNIQKRGKSDNAKGNYFVRLIRSAMIALRKEILKRHIKDFLKGEPFAKTIQQEKTAGGRIGA